MHSYDWSNEQELFFIDSDLNLNLPLNSDQTSMDLNTTRSNSSELQLS